MCPLWRGFSCCVLYSEFPLSEVLLLHIVINIHVIRAGEVAGSVQSVSRAKLTQ